MRFYSLRSLKGKEFIQFPSPSGVTTMVTLSLQLRDSEPAAFIPPPPGVTSNFVDPPNRGYVVLIPAFVFAALSFVFLVLRVYTVRIITRKQGVADCKCFQSLESAIRVLTFMLQTL